MQEVHRLMRLMRISNPDGESQRCHFARLRVKKFSISACHFASNQKHQCTIEIHIVKLGVTRSPIHETQPILSDDVYKETLLFNTVSARVVNCSVSCQEGIVKTA